MGSFGSSSRTSSKMSLLVRMSCCKSWIDRHMGRSCWTRNIHKSSKTTSRYRMGNSGSSCCWMRLDMSWTTNSTTSSLVRKSCYKSWIDRRMGKSCWTMNIHKSSKTTSRFHMGKIGNSCSMMMGSTTSWSSMTSSLGRKSCCKSWTDHHRGMSWMQSWIDHHSCRSWS